MYPNTNLQPGQSGPEVKKLQDFLVSQGFMTPQQVATGPGTYGPQTTAAVKAWQSANGVDNTSGAGYWGPRSITAASGISGTGKSDPNQPLTDEEYESGVANNPLIKQYTAQGNSVADIEHAAETGDLSGIRNQFGQPFSTQEQQDALAQSENDLQAFYKAQEEKDEADAEAALKEKQRTFQDYLINSGENFQADKATADQTAANSGVLFSGSRVQKENDLKTKYERDLAAKRAGVSADIGNTARDLQYKYGNDAIGGLSDYYKLGNNVYNPKVATGGVTSSGLSSIYNPGSYDFQGTKLAEKKTAAAKRAAGLLANRGNKLLSTSYANQF